MGGYIIEQDSGGRPPAGIGAGRVRRVLAPAHQRGPLRKTVGEQHPMVRRIKRMARLYRRQKLDRDQVRALMQQLEHSVLGICAHPAPCDGRCWPVNRSSIGLHAFAVALHLQLLEV